MKTLIILFALAFNVTILAFIAFELLTTGNITLAAQPATTVPTLQVLVLFASSAASAWCAHLALTGGAE